MLLFLHDEVSNRVCLAPNFGNVVHPERQETWSSPTCSIHSPTSRALQFLFRIYTLYIARHCLVITTNWMLFSHNYKLTGWAHNPLKNNYLSFSRFWMMNEYKNGGNWLEHIRTSGGALHYEGRYSWKLHRKLQQPILIVLFNFLKHFIF